MFSYFYKKLIALQALVFSGFLLAAGEAKAQIAGNTGGANFSTIAENITTSLEEVPGLVTGLSYLLGIVFGVMGIFKIRDHVDNPSQTPLKEGAIRLAVGGTLFALPILYEAMLNTIGDTNFGVQTPTLNAVDFNVQ